MTFVWAYGGVSRWEPGWGVGVGEGCGCCAVLCCALELSGILA